MKKLAALRYFIVALSAFNNLDNASEVRSFAYAQYITGLLVA